MEKMNGGTLQQHIDSLLASNQETMNEETVAGVMRDILNGLCLIHEKNFIHRDLKPENILINLEEDESDKLGIKQKYVAKIADFGLSAEYKFNVFSG